MSIIGTLGRGGLRIPLAASQHLVTLDGPEVEPQYLDNRIYAACAVVAAKDGQVSRLPTRVAIFPRTMSLIGEKIGRRFGLLLDGSVALDAIQEIEITDMILTDESASTFISSRSNLMSP